MMATSRKLTSPTGKAILVRPVFANVGVEYWYRDQLHRLLRTMADELQHAIESAWLESPPESGFAHDASPTVKLEQVMTKWGKRWTMRFNRLSLSLAKQFADRSFGVTQTSMRAAFKEAGFTVTFSPSKGSLEGYRAVAAENVNLIKSIPQQYLKDVQTQVWQSVIKGSDMAALAEGLRKAHGISDRRASIIAVDQTNKAKAVIQATRWKELGLTHARWEHSAAGKVPRPTHVKQNGKLYDIRKGFYDKDEGEWVHPGQLINCRCTASPVIPGDDEIDRKYGINRTDTVKGLV